MYLTSKQYDNRTRFNWGFHDGAYDQRLGKSRIEQSQHFDEVYITGYHIGFETSANGNYDHKNGTTLSDAAWDKSGLEALKQSNLTRLEIEKDLTQFIVTKYGVSIPEKTIQSVATSILSRLQRNSFSKEVIKTAKAMGLTITTLVKEIEQQWPHVNRDNKNRPDYDNN